MPCEPQILRKWGISEVGIRFYEIDAGTFMYATVFHRLTLSLKFPI